MLCHLHSVPRTWCYYRRDFIVGVIYTVSSYDMDLRYLTFLKIELGMVGHAFNPSNQVAEACRYLGEFEASLVYKSRRVRPITPRNPV